MTTEALTPAPAYVVAGTGPYAIPHPYQSAEDLVVVAILDGTNAPLVLGEDFTVAPLVALVDGGDLTLDAGAASAYAGWTLTIVRETTVEQGWQGIAGAREKGLERALDRHTQALQDARARIDRALVLPPALGVDAADLIQKILNLSDTAFGLVPQVSSLAALRGLTGAPGLTVRLTDDNRDATFVWDPTLTPADAAADPAELNLVLQTPGANGGWVNPTGDHRRGYWDNSAVPARKGRFGSGIFVGRNVSRYFGGTSGNQQGTWWADEFAATLPGASSWTYLFRNAASIFERDGGQVTASIMSRSGAGSAQTLGLTIGSLNRSEDPGASTWGIYVDAIAAPGATAHTRCAEMNVCSMSPPGTAGGETPYSSNSGLRFCLGLAAGSDGNNIFGPTYDVDEAIRVNNNGARFKRGFVFRSNSLVVDGNDEAVAVAMAQNHSLVWYGPGSVETARIVSKAGSGPAWRLAFGSVVAFQRGGASVAWLESVDNAVNFLSLQNAAAGAAPSMRANGSDTNVDVYLVPKGSGLLRVGYAAGAASDVASNRRLAVRDGAGNVVYLLATTTAP